MIRIKKTFQKGSGSRWLLLLLAIHSITFVTPLFAEGEDEVPAGATISGYVSDVENGEKLIGATVAVLGTRAGAAANASGYYVVKNIPVGTYKVRISSLGYESLEVEMTFVEGASERKDFELTPVQVETGGVTVVGEQEKRQINISKVEIPVEQLAQLRIGGEADVFRALQFLPGVLTSSQISSGLYIRGGSPDQNLVLVDGSTVYNPSHLLGFFSTFNPDAIKDVDLIKGAYPAEYGGRLSAVLDLRQKDGNSNEFEGVGSLGLISSRLSLQGPTPFGNGSYFIGGRRTYLDLITGLLPDDPENPFPDFSFYDINAKITQTLSANDALQVSGFTSADNLGLEASGLEFNLGLSNLVGSVRWTHTFADDLFFVLNAGGSEYETGFDGQNSGFFFEARNTITDYTAKSKLEWYVSDKLTVKTGVDATLYEFNYFQNFSGDSVDIVDPGTNENGQVNLLVNDWTLAGYGQANYYLTDDLSMQAGLRVDYFDLSNTVTYDPRGALRWQMMPNFALKAGLGIYHQYLRLATQPDFSFFDTWMPTDSTVVPSKAVHYVLSSESEIADGIDLNVDLYYKKLNNISDFNTTVTEAENVADVFYSGEGEAYGGEIFIQKKEGRLVGWIGYGLGWVNSRFDSINGGKEFRPKYDRRHDLKVVAQYKLSDHWDIGTSFTFQSGQSYTGATSRFRTTLPDGTSGYDLIIPSQRYGLRLPASHQLNLNVNYNSKLFGLPMRLLFDIYNVYSRRDIWFRFYDTDGEKTEVTDVRLLPIIPTVAIEVKF
ncbi:MAG: TonB-dependent receptor [Candidatus Kapaibacterium sp.]